MKVKTTVDVTITKEEYGILQDAGLILTDICNSVTLCDVCPIRHFCGTEFSPRNLFPEIANILTIEEDE